MDTERECHLDREGRWVWLGLGRWDCQGRACKPPESMLGCESHVKKNHVPKAVLERHAATLVEKLEDRDRGVRDQEAVHPAAQ